MNANRLASHRSSDSDLAAVAGHVILPEEYKELPELTEDMFAQGTVKNGSQPRSGNPKKLTSIRLPADIIERWRASGPGWQTRMAEKLTQTAPESGNG